MSEALGAGQAEEAAHLAADFAPYRGLFGGDLTAVRDELAALTAGAAGEAYRLDRGLMILEMVMLVLASLIGLGLSVIVSNRMMAGLERLIENTRRMEDGDGYEVLPVTSKDKIGKLTIAFTLIRYPWPAPRPAGIQCADGPRHRRSGGRRDRRARRAVSYGNRRHR
jgi:adenylate cyclase